MDRHAPPDPAIISQFDHRLVTILLGVSLFISLIYPQLPLSILFWTVRATYLLFAGSIFCLAFLASVAIWRWLVLRIPHYRLTTSRNSTSQTAENPAKTQGNVTQNHENTKIIFRGRREAKNLEIDAWLDNQALASRASRNQHKSTSQTTNTQTPEICSAQSTTTKPRSRSRQRRLRKPRERSLSPRPAPDYTHPLLARSEFARLNFAVKPPPPKVVAKEKNMEKKVGRTRPAKAAATVEEELVDRLGRLGIA